MLVDSPLEVLLQHIILFYLEVNGQFPWLMSKASYILIRVCSILNIWNCSFLAEVEVRLFLVSNVLTRNNNRATWDMIKIQSVKYNYLKWTLTPTKSHIVKTITILQNYLFMSKKNYWNWQQFSLMMPYDFVLSIDCIRFGNNYNWNL